MYKPELKTSEEWSKSLEFVGLIILDPDGWPRTGAAHIYNKAFYVDRITKKEFEKRLCDSTIQWSLPKI